MLSDAELDRIGKELSTYGTCSPEWLSRRAEELYAEVRRLRGVRAADAELDRIKKEVATDGFASSAWLYQAAAKLLSHIAFQSTVIRDLKTDLANENQWAAGFRACRELATEILWQYTVAKSLREQIAALTPEQYAAQTRQEDKR